MFIDCFYFVRSFLVILLGSSYRNVSPPRTNMKTILALFFYTAIFTGIGFAHCNEAFHLNEKKLSELIIKASNGNAKAAYRIWQFHSFSSRSSKDATLWLERTATLGHSEAQRWLAYLIMKQGHDYRNFGTTAEEAVFKLLTKAMKKSGVAVNELGEAYLDGYFNEKDRHVKARQAFSIGVSHHNTSSWVNLAKMLHLGEGGKVNNEEAFYLISLATNCTHPESMGGKKIWELRYKIESQLSLNQIQQIWKKIDVYINKMRKRQGGVIYPPPLLGTSIPEKEWLKYREATDLFELNHRHGLNN